MQTATDVSVIVATLNRSDYLGKCLNALIRQTVHQCRFEILVVDNGSTDDTPDVVRAISEISSNIRYLQCERPGLSAARNAGIRASNAPIVAFTDDDAVPRENWVQLVLERFGALPESIAILGGEVDPIWEAPRPAWLTDQLLRPLSAGLMWGSAPRLLRGDEWLIEVNIAYRKKHLLRCGAFPEHLGRIGETLLSCDGCVNLLLAQAGYQAFYDPQIVVGHHIHASRLTANWFRRRFFWQGVSQNRVHRYIEDMTSALGLRVGDATRVCDEEICLPSTAMGWLELFDDQSETLEFQLHTIEQLGYLLESRGLLYGR